MRDGLGGGDSMPESAASVPSRRSAHGDRVGSLVILEFLPKVLALLESDSLVLWVVRGNECVENFNPELTLSDPTDLVISGD